jgi:hypothetical protein
MRKKRRYSTRRKYNTSKKRYNKSKIKYVRSKKRNTRHHRTRNTRNKRRSIKKKLMRGGLATLANSVWEGMILGELNGKYLDLDWQKDLKDQAGSLAELVTWVNSSPYKLTPADVKVKYLLLYENIAPSEYTVLKWNTKVSPSVLPKPAFIQDIQAVAEVAPIEERLKLLPVHERDAILKMEVNLGLGDEPLRSEGTATMPYMLSRKKKTAEDITKLKHVPTLADIKVDQALEDLGYLHNPYGSRVVVVTDRGSGVMTEKQVWLGVVNDTSPFQRYRDYVHLSIPSSHVLEAEGMRQQEQAEWNKDLMDAALTENVRSRGRIASFEALQEQPRRASAEASEARTAAEASETARQAEMASELAEIDRNTQSRKAMLLGHQGNKRRMDKAHLDEVERGNAHRAHLNTLMKSARSEKAKLDRMAERERAKLGPRLRAEAEERARMAKIKSDELDARTPPEPFDLNSEEDEFDFEDYEPPVVKAPTTISQTVEYGIEELEEPPAPVVDTKLDAPVDDSLGGWSEQITHADSEAWGEASTAAKAVTAAADDATVLGMTRVETGPTLRTKGQYGGDPNALKGHVMGYGQVWIIPGFTRRSYNTGIGGEISESVDNLWISGFQLNAVLRERQLLRPHHQHDQDCKGILWLWVRDTGDDGTTKPPGNVGNKDKRYSHPIVVNSIEEVSDSGGKGIKVNGQSPNPVTLYFTHPNDLDYLLYSVGVPEANLSKSSFKDRLSVYKNHLITGEHEKNLMYYVVLDLLETKIGGNNNISLYSYEQCYKLFMYLMWKAKDHNEGDAYLEDEEEEKFIADLLQKAPQTRSLEEKQLLAEHLQKSGWPIEVPMTVGNSRVAAANMTAAATDLGNLNMSNVLDEELRGLRDEFLGGMCLAYFYLGVKCKQRYDQSMKEDEGVRWVPDAEAPSCQKCNVKFEGRRRRSHCRWCGRVVCAGCVHSAVGLPKWVEKNNPKGRKKWGPDLEARKVCRDCIHDAYEAILVAASPKGNEIHIRGKKSLRLLANLYQHRRFKDIKIQDNSIYEGLRTHFRGSYGSEQAARGGVSLDKSCMDDLDRLATEEDQMWDESGMDVSVGEVETQTRAQMDDDARKWQARIHDAVLVARKQILKEQEATRPMTDEHNKREHDERMAGIRAASTAKWRAEVLSRAKEDREYEAALDEQHAVKSRAKSLKTKAAAAKVAASDAIRAASSKKDHEAFWAAREADTARVEAETARVKVVDDVAKAKVKEYIAGTVAYLKWFAKEIVARDVTINDINIAAVLSELKWEGLSPDAWKARLEHLATEGKLPGYINDIVKAKENDEKLAKADAAAAAVTRKRVAEANVNAAAKDAAVASVAAATDTTEDLYDNMDPVEGEGGVAGRGHFGRSGFSATTEGDEPRAQPPKSVWSW